MLDEHAQIDPGECLRGAHGPRHAWRSLSPAPVALILLKWLALLFAVIRSETLVKASARLIGFLHGQLHKRV